MNISSYCEKWHELSSANGYIMLANVSALYVNALDSYIYPQITYDSNTGLLKWGQTMNVNPIISCCIIYDPKNDTRL